MEKIKKLDEIELIKLAKNSTDEKVLDTLASHAFIKVRRSVAKNRNVPKNIVNKLAIDSASNVSYWATRHQNYDQNRVIQSNDPCVVCTIDELQHHNTCPSCKSA